VLVSLIVGREVREMWVPRYDWLAEALRRDPLSTRMGYVDTGSLMLYLMQLCEKVDYKPVFYVSLFSEEESLAKVLGSSCGFVTSDRVDILRRGWVRFYFENTDCYCVVRPNARLPRTALVRNRDGKIIGKAIILTVWG
jgi:hypothetical protein